MENQAQDEDRFDCQVGKRLGASLLAVGHGSPGLDGVLREPEGDMTLPSKPKVSSHPPSSSKDELNDFVAGCGWNWQDFEVG